MVASDPLISVDSFGSFSTGSICFLIVVSRGPLAFSVVFASSVAFRVADLRGSLGSPVPFASDDAFRTIALLSVSLGPTTFMHLSNVVILE